MKTIYFLLPLLVFRITGFGQSIEPTVIGAAGSYLSGANAQLSFTVGEMMVETYLSADHIISQGFHQPFDYFVGIEEDDYHLGISIYPNPTRDILIVEAGDHTENLDLQLYDMQGKMLATDKMLPGTSRFELSMQAYSDGVYLLHVISGNRSQKAIYKIQKVN
ncbi:MAG: T9SS type A sorting domain-containing protein [Bacteroidia bacterium]